MCWGSQNICLSDGCLFSTHAWLVPKYSFLLPAAGEKQLRCCSEHPPSKYPKSQIQPGPCCHDVSSTTPSSPTLATCCGSTGKARGLSLLGKAQGKVPAPGRVARRPGKANPWWGQGIKQSPSTAPRGLMQQASLCSPCSSCIQPTPRAPREANAPIRGLRWHPPGCHSPSHPGFFSHTRSAANHCQGLSTPWGRWLQRQPELQEEVRMHLDEKTLHEVFFTRMA